MLGREAGGRILSIQRRPSKLKPELLDTRDRPEVRAEALEPQLRRWRPVPAGTGASDAPEPQGSRSPSLPVILWPRPTPAPVHTPARRPCGFLARRQLLGRLARPAPLLPPQRPRSPNPGAAPAPPAAALQTPPPQGAPDAQGARTRHAGTRRRRKSRVGVWASGGSAGRAHAAQAPRYSVRALRRPPGAAGPGERARPSGSAPSCPRAGRGRPPSGPPASRRTAGRRRREGLEPALRPRPQGRARRRPAQRRAARRSSGAVPAPSGFSPTPASARLRVT